MVLIPSGSHATKSRSRSPTICFPTLLGSAVKTERVPTERLVPLFMEGRITPCNSGECAGEAAVTDSLISTAIGMGGGLVDNVAPVATAVA